MEVPCWHLYFYRIFSALDTGICITGTLSSAENSVE